jgi:uncharacterized damage-inducible protein DinB
MDLLAYFQMLARYNRVANERIYEACAGLEDAEYRKQRRGSFGSIHGLLNHIMLGDRTWMARFEGGGHETPVLSTILFDELTALRTARSREDSRIEKFFNDVDAAFLSRSCEYVNNQGKLYVELAPIAVGHFFNHQTHHRGQIHVMLSQTSVSLPSLDMHRILNP